MDTTKKTVSSPNFPGGSKSRVNRAGERVRLGNATNEDFIVIDEWRSAHRAVLNTFKAMLIQRARNKGITFAQRHKRKRTIMDKLVRIPGMSLSRMDDVAGCRLIFKSIKELYAFRDKLHSANFKHKRRSPENPDKYDYIKTPKETGYRGVHDVYEYDVNSKVGAHLKGLYVEIQYRTVIQHAWATTVEVIGFITESQPKFQQGDKRYEHAMVMASEILARAHEKMHGHLPDLSDIELVEQFLEADKELGLLSMLRNLNAANGSLSNKRNAILIMSDNAPLEIRQFRDATDAMRALFELENQFPNNDIVLVRADSSDEVRFAFKNYFSDARDFIRLIDDGCTKLLKSKKVVKVGQPIIRRT